MREAVNTYRLVPAAFEPTLRRRLRQRLRWALPSLVLVLVTVLLILTRVQPGLAETLPFSLPVVVACLGFGVFRSARLARRNGRSDWDSYQLSLADDGLRRVVSSLPALEITRAEVTHLFDSPGEGVTVMTADPQRFVFIPEQLEDYSGVREQLAGWRAFEAPRVRRARAVQMAWTLLLLGLWLATGLLRDVPLALLAGVGLWIVGGISIRETLRSGILDRRYRRRVLGLLGFFLLSPLARPLSYWVGIRRAGPAVDGAAQSLSAGQMV
jgi:hypothetical protein